MADNRIIPEGAVDERIFVSCYEKQMRALAAIGLTAASGRSQSTLLFGLPGSGKTSALNALTRILERDFGKSFYFHYIESTRFFSQRRSEPGPSKDPFEEIRRSISKRPAMICFDEIDIISRPRIELDFFGFLLMNQFAMFLDNIMTENETWVIGVANSPGECDPAIMQRFRIPVFFDLPDLDVIEAIIGNMLGKGRNKAVARLLLRKTSEIGIHLSLHALLSACRELNREKEALNEWPDEDIVSRILAIRGSGIPAESLRNYERINAGFIKVSLNEALPFWSKELERFGGTQP